MLKLSDLNGAVSEGIISSDQAQRLRDYARRMATASEESLEFSQDTRDEPFRLLRGFRDVFIAIGIVIFAVGITTLGATVAGGMDNFQGVLPTGDALGVRVIVVTFGLVVFGLVLAEWITRRQRLPLSSLVLSLAFAVWSSAFVTSVAAFIWPDLFFGLNTAGSVASWSFFFGAVIGLIGFYWRYRLPFTLLPLAGSAVGFTYFILVALVGPDWSELHTRIAIGGMGLIVFAAAMAFDMRDRLRVKRFAECAFWLHLLAAPMLVHSLLLGNASDEPNLALVLGSMVVLALVALLIDRRALLVSGLTYLAVAISRIVSNSDLLSDNAFAFTAFFLGAGVLCLGLGWTPIRDAVLKLLPEGGLKALLPPAASG